MPSYRHFGAFRLFLAFLVMLQHYLVNLAPDPLAAAALPYEVGSVAVLVFFSLSGFVIFEAADIFYRNRAYAFLANRLLRIVPQFMLATVLAIIIFYYFHSVGTLRVGRGEAFLPHDIFSATNIVANLSSFLPWKAFMSYSFVEPAWAIRVEMIFYFAVFVILMVSGVLARHKGPHLYMVSLGMAIFFVPFFGLSMLGKGPESLMFLPYFVFGSALYLWVSQENRASGVTIFISLAAIVTQFLSQPSHHKAFGFERAVAAELFLLLTLLMMMYILARTGFNRGRRLDKMLGDFTYPLYLLHENVMVVVLSVTTGFSYFGLFTAVVGALALASASYFAVEPNVAKLRDFVRGGRLHSETNKRQLQMQS